MGVKSASQATPKTALLLLFYIEENLYAIDTSRVIEIVPAVLLRTVETAPDYIAGVFNYHNTITPVLDLCRLIRGTSCQIRYSTRLIIVNYWTSSSQGEPLEQQRPLGLLVERVTETLKVHFEMLLNTENINSSSTMGELFIAERGMIQKVNWENLVADNLYSALVAEGSR